MITCDNNLIIFLKYPEKGKVKTRLAKEIGNEKALLIHKKLVSKILNQINHNNYDISICYYPKDKNREVIKWINIKDYKYVPQKGTDLGIKMLNAFIDSLSSGYKRTVLIGTDCLEINDSIISKSFHLLEGNDLVLGPATDGGYYLIGLKTIFESLFQNISWSTDKVLKQTLNRVKELNIEYKFLDFCNDIDTLEDLNNYKYLLNE
jgi:rSAM/selenodomain-associated transferase 1